MIQYGKRKRNISINSNTGSYESYNTRSIESGDTDINSNKEIVPYHDDQPNDPDNSTSDNEYSSEMPRNKIRNKGKHPARNSRTKESSKGKEKAGGNKNDKSKKSYGSMEQYVFKT